MGSEVQRNPYRDAYVSANTELDEIMEQCARLRVRKEKIEVAIDALRQVIEVGGQVIPINQAVHPVQAEPPRREVPVPVAQPQEEARPVAQPQAVRPAPAPAPAQAAMDETPDSLEKRIASALGRVAFA